MDNQHLCAITPPFPIHLTPLPPNSNPPCPQNIQPAGLAKVKNQELRDFIMLCINHNPAMRPEARQLLKHPFFESIRAKQPGLTSSVSGSMLSERPLGEVGGRLSFCVSDRGTSLGRGRCCMLHAHSGCAGPACSGVLSASHSISQQNSALLS